jgi:hypothetical protein
VRGAPTTGESDPWTLKSVSGVGSNGYGNVLPEGGGSLRPDFTSSGGPIEFGYFTSNSTGFANGRVTEWSIDSFRVRVESSVPEASGAMLLLLAGARLAARAVRVLTG